MEKILKAKERGHTKIGWLNSHHSFSFGQYYNPENMGFRVLRVINDDVVSGGAGFGEHPHRDMEIISYVVEGGLEHRDSLGNGGVIKPGDVQIMSAGTGIRHAEFNASETEPVRFLQIWIPPERGGISPRYDQRRFPIVEKTGTLHLLLSPESRGDSLPIHQDVSLYGGRFDGEESATLSLDESRHAWVQVVRGSIDVNDHPLKEGDGLALSDVRELRFHTGKKAEILVFDLP